MKFNQYLWNLYKNSSEGKSAIAAFSDRKEWMEEERLFEKYNPKIKDSFNSEMICGILEDFWCYKVSEHEGTELQSLEELLINDNTATILPMFYRENSYQSHLTD